MLKAMGIEEDAIEQIIDAHTDTTDSLKAERDRYKEEAGKARGLEEELDTVRKQLEDASDTSAYDELKKQYDKEHKELDKLRESNESLQSEFDGYKAEVQATESKRQKESAYRKLLENAGISPKYVGKVLRVADVDSIEFEEDGSVKDSDALTEGIKSEWSEFITTTQTKGADPATPPKGNNTEGVSERAQRIINNHYEKKYGKTEE